METMYWIDVIGNISTTATILTVIFAIVAVIYLVITAVVISEGADDDDVKFGKKWFKRLGVATIVFLIVSVFTPSTESMCMIYGVGGTIDYIKSNETAKQLPDKVVIALDKYIDSLNEDKEKTND